MKISIYVDEDSQSSSLVQALMTRGVDVITAGQAGMLGHSDVEQLEWAGVHGRVLFSSKLETSMRYTPAFSLRGARMQGSYLRNNNITRWAN